MSFNCDIGTDAPHLICMMFLFQNDQLDLKHFDPEFVQEPVPASVSYSNNSTCRLVSASVMEADSVFSGFSYVPPSEDAFE